mmetsp:Transcript_56890/g.83469  ORF Transcript_56890/g.83469 Transcript_56890/m.83469 type:complete len:92 (+) Transcript_56890:139-414(+)|eukprot:CAMPEP_0179444310 /NCGR_PEP_ID=MMETSP0799-20121207/27771_1 /TAXON_ID=46947 /ORGANISM="Geminigera cryophila, Strain CCMP2564" /LENGTH=91 /DNA_ID=CAMNT_0021231255 /DNA_START=165 /DNA_END=440 /DNA_ORIENTATION=+
MAPSKSKSSSVSNRASVSLSSSPEATPGMLAAAMVSGSWSGIGEIHDCLPVSNSTALGPKNCQAETPQEPPQLHGVDEIHDALVFFPGSFD